MTPLAFPAFAMTPLRLHLRALGRGCNCIGVCCSQGRLACWKGLRSGRWLRVKDVVSTRSGATSWLVDVNDRLELCETGIPMQTWVPIWVLDDTLCLGPGRGFPTPVPCGSIATLTLSVHPSAFAMTPLAFPAFAMTPLRLHLRALGRGCNCIGVCCSQGRRGQDTKGEGTGSPHRKGRLVTFCTRRRETRPGGYSGNLKT